MSELQRLEKPYRRIMICWVVVTSVQALAKRAGRSYSIKLIERNTRVQRSYLKN